MHIQTISYTKTFNLGNYSSEKIGVEVCLHQGESADKALNIAKGLVEEYHLKSVKNIPEIGFEEPAQIIQTQTPQTLIEKTKMFIDACTNEEELKAWFFMAKGKPELKEYYNDKFQILKNK